MPATIRDTGSDVAICARCGEDNPERARFCLTCGAPLAAARFPAVEERKVVTVLFCDLVGFTAHSEHADPEDVRARIAPYFARLRLATESFGGTVEKFIGDAVQSIFGAPVVHEDDPERAVRAALRILEEIEDLNAKDPTLQLKVRIGVNTGEVLVRLAAAAEENEGLLTGDVVNTASRLQTVAPEGCIVVGEATYRATRDVVEYEALDPVSVKGKSEPLRIWLAKSARSPYGAGVTLTLATPLIGRDLDLALLENAYQKAARTSSVQLVTLLGEPGIGKSRLVAELAATFEASPDANTWRQGRCLPYGDGITFWALGEIVKAHAGIYDSDPPEVATSKLRAVLPPGEDREWLLQRLLPLLGLGSSRGTEREEAFTAWRRFLESIAEDRPAVFVFEDLHWADDALLAFLMHLADRATGVPMLLVCTARPELLERHPTWAGGVRNAATIELSPLTDAEMATLISGLLGQGELSADLGSSILARSGGNPLYAEEFIRLLRDRGLLIREGATVTVDSDVEPPLPESIAALIAARIDTLPPDRKALLADAAVIGEVFWAGGVAAMGERDPREVGEALHDLTRKELIRPSRTSSMPGEAEFAFWHGLVREVAYAQIPRAARAERHRRAAAWIEAAAPERLEDMSDVLAHHYTTALDLSRASGRAEEAGEVEPLALRYLALAGDRAAALNVTRAEAQYRRALELAPPGHPQRARLLGNLAEAVQVSGKLTDAADLFDQAIAAHKEMGETAQAVDMMLRFVLVLGVGGEVDRSRTLLDQLIADLEREGPSPQLAQAYAEKAYPGWGMPYAEAIAWADRALALADRLDLSAVRARALAFRGSSRAGLGDPEGLDDMRSALGLSLSLGLARQTYVTYFNLVGTLCYEDPGSALEIAEEGLAFVGDRGLAEGAAWIRAFRLRAMFQVGLWQELLAEVDELVAWAEQLGYGWVAVTASQPKGWVLSLTGQAADDADPSPDDASGAGPEGTATATTSRLPFVPGSHEVDGARAGPALEALIAEIEVEPGSLLELICEAAREAAVLGRHDLLERCGGLLEGELAICRHSREAWTALSAELDGRLEDGLKSFARAGHGWAEFGNPYEQGQSLVGEARCLLGLGRRGDAAARLRRAIELFGSLRAEPALGEARELLDRATR